MDHKTIVYNGLKFSLNIKEKTASVIGFDSPNPDIIIPKMVTSDTESYIVTTIDDCAFRRSQIKSIQFEPDTKIQSIGQHAITYSLIQTISFPSNIIEFKEDWCKDDHNFKEIKVFPNGDENIKLIENDKILVGKSDSKSDIFDVIIIAAKRDIDQITIPSYIKKINAHSFEHCRKLKHVKIPENSQLQTIGNFAFYDTAIQEISIPSNIITIGKGWCCGTFQLNKINIIPNGDTNVKLIENNKVLIGKSDLKSEIFDVLYYADRDIQKFNLPSQIRKIESYALDCVDLHDFEFPNDSELELISIHSFASTSLEKVLIPDNVKKIDEGAFCWCTKLVSVEFSPNSKIKTIEKYAFNGSSLENISIPSSIIKMDGFCSELYSLNNINVIQKDVVNIKYIDNKVLVGKFDVNVDEFDVILFANRKIKYLKIPSNIKKLAAHAFEHCFSLNKIEIDDDSNLQFIDENVFSGNPISSIFIPSNVIQIRKNALSYCNQLKIIEVANPDLLQIDKDNNFYNFSENGLSPIILVAVK